MRLLQFRRKFLRRWAWARVAAAELLQFEVLASPLVLVRIGGFGKRLLVFIDICSVLVVRNLWEAGSTGCYFLLAQGLHDWCRSEEV